MDTFCWRRRLFERLEINTRGGPELILATIVEANKRLRVIPFDPLLENAGM
jgi:hypothetical protein